LRGGAGRFGSEVHVSPAIGRTLTIVAIAVLAFDGAALAAIGFMSGRMVLVAVGLVFFLSSGLVVLYWRRHLRRVDEIRTARRALGDEARALRESVSGKRKA
jgi:membrane protein implicated in regulation of membrane protease activity